jgi:hypothetical protein
MDKLSFGYNGKNVWYDEIYGDILNNKQQRLKDYLSAWINTKYDEE